MKTYKATGINLKGAPLGESDRLLTILTREHGLIRAVAPGARKHQSSLRGRSGLFVVNQLLIVKGKSLDKVIQAESVTSYPGLSQDLRRLTAGQYLAELVLFQAFSEQPQDELFSLLSDYLHRLEHLPASAVLPCLVHAVFHLLTLAGVAPQVQTCCVTQEALIPNFDTPDWQAGFHAEAGGVVTLAALEQLIAKKTLPKRTNSSNPHPQSLDLAENKRGFAHSHNGTLNSDTLSSDTVSRVTEQGSSYRVSGKTSPSKLRRSSDLGQSLGALELAILQQLNQPEILNTEGKLLVSYNLQATQPPSSGSWLFLERLLRHYAQYHFERPIQSATLIESCFSADS